MRGAAARRHRRWNVMRGNKERGAGRRRRERRVAKRR